MSGPASPQTSTQSSTGQQNSNAFGTSDTGPNSFITPYLQSGIGALASNFNANPTAPGYFPGSTVATPSPQTTGALNQTYNFGMGGGAPTTGAAEQGLMPFLNGSYLDLSKPRFSVAPYRPSRSRRIRRSRIPFCQESRAPSRARAAPPSREMPPTRRPSRRSRPSARRRATPSPRWLTRPISRAWNTLTAAGLSPSLQSADYQNLGAALGAGQTMDQQTQAQIDAQIARYNYGATAQPNYISNYLQQILAGYPGGSGSFNSNTNGSSNGFSTGTVTPASNSTSSLVSGGLGLAGLALNAFSDGGPFAAFSDRRLKDVHARVGFTDEGLPLYLFHYKNGDGAPRIGPMAQDVEELHPEAVSLHPSGFKIVDFAAMPIGGLM